MFYKLQKLYEYLLNNNYLSDAKRIKEITYEIEKGRPDLAKDWLIAMCHPRYLGDLYIKEFNSVYEWWNFLSEISDEIKKM